MANDGSGKYKIIKPKSFSTKKTHLKLMSKNIPEKKKNVLEEEKDNLSFGIEMGDGEDASLLRYLVYGRRSQI